MIDPPSVRRLQLIGEGRSIARGPRVAGSAMGRCFKDTNYRLCIMKYGRLELPVGSS